MYGNRGSDKEKVTRKRRGSGSFCACVSVRRSDKA
jgi:hypothetical protein